MPVTFNISLSIFIKSPTTKTVVSSTSMDVAFALVIAPLSKLAEPLACVIALKPPSPLPCASPL